jgi:hypothetical protein
VRGGWVIACAALACVPVAQPEAATRGADMST